MVRILLALLLLWAGFCAPASAGQRPPVILISIDGFRSDYLDRGVTPVLSRLAADGARGAMRPSFPSKTFPNHYTLVTGLRPDRHGIVENTFEDPEIPGVTFRMANRDAVRDRRWWDQGEPIWVTVERAGLPTAPIFWPGSEAAVRGVRPTHWRAFDMTRPHADRVDLLLALLDLPAAQRPAFLTLYFDSVDTAGHHHGPQSAEVNAAIGDVDSAIGRLLEGLRARKLPANLVVVADHGMAEVAPDRRIVVGDLVTPDLGRALSVGAFLSFYPAKGREIEAEQALLRPHAHMACWRRSEIPARFHYGRNPRVAPIFCLPETGWSITRRSEDKVEGGAHGFDPYSPEMEAIFIAHGPGIRAGVVLPTFDNVSVHPLLGRLLGVPAPAGDGRPEDTAQALR
jgi:predicted AlkP superfamily pyrophosphatase or phosphodiesterase